MCRKSAQDLAKLKPELDKSGIRLIAVVKERLGYEDFLEHYWPAEIYLDSDRTWWEANDAGAEGLMSVAYSLAFGKAGTLYKEAKEAGVDGNLRGEGLKRGGVIIIGPGASGLEGEEVPNNNNNNHSSSSSSSNMGVLFHSKEVSLGAHPSNEEIMEVVERMRAAIAKREAESASDKGKGEEKEGEKEKLGSKRSSKEVTSFV